MGVAPAATILHAQQSVVLSVNPYAAPASQIDALLLRLSTKPVTNDLMGGNRGRNTSLDLVCKCLERRMTEIDSAAPELLLRFAFHATRARFGAG